MSIPSHPLADHILVDFAYECDQVRNAPKLFLGALRSGNLREDHIVDLLRHTEFRRWLETLDKSGLFLEVDNSRNETRWETELSFVSAKIVSTLLKFVEKEGNAKVIILSFFCAQKKFEEEHVDDCAKELLTELFLQLIDQYRGFNVALLEEIHHALTKIYRLRFRELPMGFESICNVFIEALMALPRSISIYIVVDAFDFFLAKSHGHRLAPVLFALMFQALSSVTATVKLLFVSRNKIRWDEPRREYDYTEDKENQWTGMEQHSTFQTLLLPKESGEDRRYTESEWESAIWDAPYWFRNHQ